MDGSLSNGAATGAKSTNCTLPLLWLWSNRILVEYYNSQLPLPTEMYDLLYNGVFQNKYKHNVIAFMLTSELHVLLCYSLHNFFGESSFNLYHHSSIPKRCNGLTRHFCDHRFSNNILKKRRLEVGKEMEWGVMGNWREVMHGYEQYTLSKCVTLSKWKELLIV